MIQEWLNDIADTLSLLKEQIQGLSNSLDIDEDEDEDEDEDDLKGKNHE